MTDWSVSEWAAVITAVAVLIASVTGAVSVWLGHRKPKPKPPPPARTYSSFKSRRRP